MSDTLNTPATPGAVDAPVTLADAAPTLAQQLYSTPPVVPQQTATTVEAATPAVEVKPEDAAPIEAPEYIQGDDSQWRRADGTFATAEELAQIEAQLAEAEKVKAEEDANRAATVVQVRGRNGEMVEVEAPDEETAQLLRQNVNDGMRRREYLEGKAEVEARASVIARAEAMIAHNPIGFVQENLTTEQQVELAAALLAPHFKALIPIIQQYDADPDSRITATAEAQLRIKQQTEEFKAHQVAQQSAVEIRNAVTALIPDDASEEQVSQFWQLARAKAFAANEAGQPFTAENVRQHLADVLAFLGFASAGDTPAAKARPRITLAKTPQTKPAAPSEGNKASQQRLRLVRQQRNAAAIPPQGRSGHGKPVAPTMDRAFQDAANLLYGQTTRAS